MRTKSGQNTFDIYEQLRAGLLYPSIVYIPMAAVLEYAEPEEVEELQKIIQPFDTLWICESLEINYPLEADTDLQLLLKKQDVLKKNLFDLMNYKQILEPEQFVHLEKSYKEFLNVCFYFSQEMVKAIKESKDERLTKYSKLFELQDFHYQNHFNAIEENFPTSEEEKKTWHIRETIDDEKLTETASFENNTNQQTEKKVQKKKQQYITDEESKQYLLETVFDIKIQ